MQIVDFHEKTFNEIPRQDNPAFMNKKEWDAAGEDGCLLITKQDPNKTPYKNNGRFCVFEIEPVENIDNNDSVIYLGLFWDINVARLFAESYVQYIEDSNLESK